MTVALTVFLLVVGKEPHWFMLSTGVTGAVLFGLFLGGYYRWSARRMELPKWSAFPAYEGEDDVW